MTLDQQAVEEVGRQNDRLNDWLQRFAAENPDLFAGGFFSRDGAARQALWQCGDGWIVGYTTERIKGGPFDGKFAAMAYKPLGRGARTGKATRHQRVYFRGFAKRKTARARAEAMYDQHRK